jgi:NET1-associated nuclear protein 1 (U3 small nucleolar RNA-associated protein 17)
VNSLAFSIDGEYLISGGEEGVLVYWQLQTFHKQFLPRLGASIEKIVCSPNHKLYGLFLGDNSFKIISAYDNSVVQAIQGLQYATSNKHPLLQSNGGIVVHPGTNDLVLNGIPGALQFWNFFSKKHTMQINVSELPRVTKTDSGVIWPSLVKHVAFSKNGEWMITADSRNDEEVYLKFWQFNANSKKYALVVKISNPHDGEISHICFSPVGLSNSKFVAVSTGHDGCFKFWSLNNMGWYCSASGFWRKLPITDMSFSNDGSVLALSFGHIITLWDPVTLLLCAVLSRPNKTNPIKYLSFVGKNLIAVTGSRLYLWDVIQKNIIWSVQQVNISNLVILNDKKFSVSCSSPKGVFILNFSQETPTPISVINIIDGVKAISCLNGEIVYLNDHFELKTLGKQEKSETIINNEIQETTSHFVSMFGKFSTNEPNDQAVEYPNVLENDFKLFNMPCHSIPTISSYFDDFVGQLLLKRDVKESEDCEKAKEDDEAKQAENVLQMEEIKPSLMNLDFVVDFFNTRMVIALENVGR